MSEDNFKVLIVCSGNSEKLSPFIEEQAGSLSKLGLKIDFFRIRGKGIFGYLRNYFRYMTKIRKFKPDIIHAHYGLSGLFVNFQRKIPVVTTYHGSDLLIGRINRFLSFVSVILSKHCIYVNGAMKTNKAFDKGNVIPCGVDINFFCSVDKNDARKSLNDKMTFNNGVKYILFSSRFDYYEKNSSLAINAVKLLGESFKLIELKEFSRLEVKYLLNACDLVLMTSLSEGSPQIIKEAMACNCPIVSTDIGDVKHAIDGIKGCFITSYDLYDVSEKIKTASEVGKSESREKLLKLQLDLETISLKILELYKNILV